VESLVSDIGYREMTGSAWSMQHPIDNRHILGRAIEHITSHLQYLLSHALCRDLDAASADIGRAGCIRAVVKYARVGVDGTPDNLLHAYAQGLSRDLHHDV